MYDQSSALIASVLFAGILVVIEMGYRIGRAMRAIVTESIRSQMNAIQAAVLGILALLLAFSFSLALQRYDSRSQAIVEEANAISTAYLRAQLLPADMRDQARALVAEYLDLRIAAGKIDLSERTTREPLLQRAGQVADQLWGYARRAVEQDARSVASGLFVQSVNELIDSYGRRNAALERHVPEFVLILLFVTFLMTGSILGYVSGIDRNRAAFPMTMMVALVVLLVFLVVDLDRPRRGIIQVNQNSLLELQQTIAGARPPQPR